MSVSGNEKTRRSQGPMIKDPTMSRPAVLKYLGLTAEELSTLCHKKRFPAPAHFAMGTEPRWRQSVVKAWKVEHADYVAFLIAKREESAHVHAY